MTARRRDTTQLEMFLLIEGNSNPPDLPVISKPIPLTESQINDLFGEFYRSYPRHVAPKAARKAFGTAIKEATFDQIMEATARYATDIERKGTRPHFVAHPATWLNAGRWADEPDAAPTNSTTASFARIGLEFRAAGGVRR